jgi:hypothetical protein
MSIQNELIHEMLVVHAEAQRFDSLFDDLAVQTACQQ